MATGRRLLEESMPANYKQGYLYPTHYSSSIKKKPNGGFRKLRLDKIRKAGQTKVRKQLEKELNKELNEDDSRRM